MQRFCSWLPQRFKNFWNIFQLFVMYWISADLNLKINKKARKHFRAWVFLSEMYSVFWKKLQWNSNYKRVEKAKAPNFFRALTFLLKKDSVLFTSSRLYKRSISPGSVHDSSLASSGWPDNLGSVSYLTFLTTWLDLSWRRDDFKVVWF